MAHTVAELYYVPYAKPEPVGTPFGPVVDLHRAYVLHLVDVVFPPDTLLLGLERALGARVLLVEGNYGADRGPIGAYTLDQFCELVKSVTS